ncbi:MAG: energy transducer TonB [Bacteroidales bacterium]|nr:energy transducer TonB [Bacteroidales bacterium]
MRLNREDKAGLYVTAIFHLAVIIILLLVQIGRELGKEDTFVLDFSKQEEIEREEKEMAFKEDISNRLDELLRQAPSQHVRNIAVDGLSQLKDDRNTDASKLYEDARRLAEDLKDPGRQSAIEEDARDEAVEAWNPNTPSDKKRDYSGPSVLSYILEGRKASHLEIPAYRCYGGGQVTVIITVNPQGTVVNAKIMEDVSSADQCLRNFATRAARLSKFSATTATTQNQLGEITYAFIAQ